MIAKVKNMSSVNKRKVLTITAILFLVFFFTSHTTEAQTNEEQQLEQTPLELTSTTLSGLPLTGQAASLLTALQELLNKLQTLITPNKEIRILGNL